MCGLIGFATNDVTDANKRKDFVKLALYLDTVRGYDSTGIAMIRENFKTKFLEQVDLFKKPLPGYDFIELAQFERMWRIPADIKYLIGHNRSATKGNITSSNAHPFHHEDIILAHNGTLTNSFSLDGKFDDFDVDSDRLAYHMTRHPAQQVLEIIEGSFTLTWADLKTDTLHFARNKERPLYYALTKDHKTLLWASELWILNVAAIKAGLSVVDPIQLPIGEHHIFHYKGADLKPIEIVKFTPRESKSYSYGNTCGWHNDGEGDYPLSKSDAAKASAAAGAANNDPATNGSTGTIKTKDNRISTILQSYNLKPDQTVEFRPTNFAPFAHTPTRGHLWGVMWVKQTFGNEDTYDSFKEIPITCVAYNVPNYLALFNSKKGVFAATIRTVRLVSIGDLPVSARRDAQGNISEIRVLVLDNAIFVEDSVGNKTDELSDEFGRVLEDDHAETVLVQGPQKQMMTLEKFTQLTRFGCGGCTKPILPADASILKWSRDGLTPVCPTCANDEQTKSILSLD